MALESMATPLGVRPGPSRPGVPAAWRHGLVAAFGLCVVVLVAAGILRGREPRREPGVVAIIERVKPAQLPAPSTHSQAPAGPRSPAAEIEAGSGVRIVRQNGGVPPGGVVIKVPEARAPEAGRVTASIVDPRVSERTHLGALPRIADDGTPPRLAYAQPFARPDRPMIGVVMTGVGIGARGTADAISRLPGAVTLAFAPYGRDLETQVARARREGHEILLQVPMEPQDYPESDPGPHTLRASAPARENIERLHWLMSRFPGYVGLMNFMGGRLMGEPGTYGTLLEEINRRGLMFLDDGTAAGSRTAELGGKLGLPVLVADKAVEAGAAATLDAQLAEIEQIARRRGSAIITVPALPANVERIAAWQRGLAERGLALAPISIIIAHGSR